MSIWTFGLAVLVLMPSESGSAGFHLGGTRLNREQHGLRLRGSLGPLLPLIGGGRFSGFCHGLVFHDVRDRFARYGTPQSLRQFVRVAQFALPDDDHFPAVPAEFFPVSVIALTRASELRQPVLATGSRGARAWATGMPVPETAVDEHDGAMFGQHDIRIAGQIGAMQSESKSKAVKERPDLLFRRRVP